jgi:hypothetical protein
LLSCGCRSRRRQAASTAECLARGEVDVQERPTYGPGRPSSQQPRVVQALWYTRQVTLHERSESLARKTHETGCFVLLTKVPTGGEMAQRAGDVLRAYKEQHGSEPNYDFLQAPLIVKSLLLTKPERIEALGLVLLLALLLGRLVERTRRVPVETPGQPLPGWDKKATQQPTAFMLLPKVAGVMGLKVEGHRQLVPPCRRSNRHTSWHGVSRPPPAPLPSVANETMRALAGAQKQRPRSVRRDSYWRQPLSRPVCAPRPRVVLPQMFQELLRVPWVSEVGGPNEGKRPLPGGPAALPRIRAQAARASPGPPRVRTSGGQEGAESHALEWFSMASPSALEGTPRTNPQNPREKGAECVTASFSLGHIINLYLFYILY